MPAGYPNFSWFVRAVKILPIVAGAALAGGVIGGFSVLAVDTVLTASPRQAANVSPSPVPSKAVRTIDRAPPAPDATLGAAAAPPAQVQAAPSPAQMQAAPLPSQAQAAAPATQANPAPATPAPPVVVQTQTPSQTPWPDAMSRSHAAPAVISTTTAPQPVPTESTPALPLKAATGSAARSDATKRRDVTSSRLSQSGDNYARGPNGRRMYDYYGNAKYISRAKSKDLGDTRTQDADTRDRNDNDADNAPDQPNGAPQVKMRRSSTRDDSDVITTRTRVIDGRRQQADPDAQSSDERQEAAPRPEPFWGIFGGQNKRDDDDQ